MYIFKNRLCLLLLLCIFFSISSCGDDNINEGDVIYVDSSSPFYDKSIDDVFRSWVIYAIGPHIKEDLGIPHHMKLVRHKSWVHTKNQATYILEAGTSDIEGSELSIKVNDIEIQALENDSFISYGFTNEGNLFFYGNEISQSLNETDFNKIKYEFKIDNVTYIGSFFEPGCIDDGTLENIYEVKIDEGVLLKWGGFSVSNGKIRINIGHTGTFDGSPRQPDQTFILDDTGSFFVSPEILNKYSIGDKLGFNISRTSFVKTNSLVIQCFDSMSYPGISLK